MNWRKLIAWAKTHRLRTGIIAGICILVLGGVAFAGKGNGDHEVVGVVRRDVVEEVRIAGTVEASIVSDLGFEVSGIARSISVKVNDIVYRGQTLVTLGLGTLIAERESAEARLAVKQAEANNTTVSLDAIREKHDTLVQNAYSELLSEDLVAEAQSSNYTQTPPTVSGRYTGKEGTYKLIVRRGTQMEKTDLYVFNLEDVDPIEINKTGPTPLGTRGLFVSFPEEPAAYDDTVWYVEIPNTKSASYATNYSAYQDALRERDRALEEGEAELRDGISGSSIAAAEIKEAEAEVARVQALISERVLVAPFSGVVTAVNIDPGETVSVNVPVVSLISNDGFGVEVDLPEIDSIKVKNGNTATVSLDALGPDEKLSASVVSVNRTETVVDGISIYEARLAFDTDDPRIASGMTAEVAIKTDSRENVLAIPVRAVKFREDGTTYVTVEDGEEERETEIVQGLRGSDGFVEVLAGLSEGDSVIIPK